MPDKRLTMHTFQLSSSGKKFHTYEPSFIPEFMLGDIAFGLITILPGSFIFRLLKYECECHFQTFPVVAMISVRFLTCEKFKKPIFCNLRSDATAHHKWLWRLFFFKPCHVFGHPQEGSTIQGYRLASSWKVLKLTITSLRFLFFKDTVNVLVFLNWMTYESFEKPTRKFTSTFFKL